MVSDRILINGGEIKFLEAVYYTLDLNNHPGRHLSTHAHKEKIVYEVLHETVRENCVPQYENTN